MRKRGSLVGGLLGLVFWALYACPALAGPGDLDPSFGNGGKSVIDLGGAESTNGMFLQADGKIVVSGSLQIGGNDQDILVTRLLNPSGALDLSFAPNFPGGNGYPRLDFGDDVGEELLQEPGGAIDVVGASTTGGSQDFALAHLDPQGNLNDYLVDKFSNLSFPGAADMGLGVALQGGNIIVAGASTLNGTQDFAVSRVLSPDLELDNSFGEAGGAFVNFGPGPGGSDQANDVAVGADGRIVVAGFAGVELGVARLLQNGAPDSSFSGDGKLSIPGLSGRAVALQPDGKILVAGDVGIDNFFLMRFNPDGTPDPSFGGDGRSVIDFGGDDHAYDFAVQPDGKFVVVGSTNSPDANDFAIARLQPTGLLDETFGSGGKIRVDLSQYDLATGVALQADGKIVVAGYASSGGNDIAAVRLKGDPGGGPGANVRCAGKRATIIGTNGRNKLKGTKHRDVIAALGGRDTVKGLKGNDLICGGKAKDRIFGGPGNDTLLGQQGNDLLKGGPGKKDKLKGGPGKDVQRQ